MLIPKDSQSSPGLRVFVPFETLAAGVLAAFYVALLIFRHSSHSGKSDENANFAKGSKAYSRRKRHGESMDSLGSSCPNSTAIVRIVFSSGSASLLRVNPR
jgi:hypothetical protein